MALTKLEFRAGIVKDDSALATEGGWVDGDKVRFRAGRPQTVGGWERVTVTAIEGICRGLHAWAGLDGISRAAIGTHSHLYAYYGGGLYDVTPVGLAVGLVSSLGGTGYGTGAYGEGTFGAVSTSDFLPRTWSLSNWGEHLLANPRRGSLYEWTGGLASPATQVLNSPDEVGSHFVSAERIVVCCGATEYGGTDFDPMLLWWSDQEDNTNWTPSATNQAGFLSLTHGGRIVRGLASRGRNLIWTDTSLIGLNYLGDPTLVFGQEMLGQGCGLIGANAVCEKDGSAFWMSGSGEFYQFTGGRAEPIPCPVRRHVFDNLDWAQAEKVYCGYNGSNAEVWWFYPDSRDGDECSRYVAYCYQDQAWTVGTWDRTAWIDGGVLENPLAASSDGYLYWHERGQTADGGPITAYLESAPSDVDDGDQLLAVLRVVPDFEDMAGGLSLSFLCRPWPTATLTTHGPYDVLTTTEKIDLRLTARQIALRIDSASAPSFWRLGAVRADLRPTGSKR
jgi:hypothetical protein